MSADRRGQADPGEEEVPLVAKVGAPKSGTTVVGKRRVMRNMVVLGFVALVVVVVCGVWSSIPRSSGSTSPSKTAALTVSRSNYSTFDASWYPWEHIAEPFVLSTLTVVCSSGLCDGRQAKWSVWDGIKYSTVSESATTTVAGTLSCRFEFLRPGHEHRVTISDASAGGDAVPSV